MVSSPAISTHGSPRRLRTSKPSSTSRSNSSNSISQGSLRQCAKAEFSKRRSEINGVFDTYRKWVEDTLSAEPKPWIQVMLAACHPDLIVAATRAGA